MKLTPLMIMVAAAIAYLPAGCGGPAMPPTDAELAAAFPAREPDLERLGAMLEADGVSAKHFQFLGQPGGETPSPAGLTAARLEEYRELMKKAGVVRVEEDFAQPQMQPFHIVFYIGCYNLHRAVFNKGYVYLSSSARLNPEERVIEAENLDALDLTTHCTAYRSLSGPWYMYYCGGD